MVRLVQYRTEHSKQPRTLYLTTGTNPCGCGSNCYHYEREQGHMYAVCNCCGADIEKIKPQYAMTEHNYGVWKPKKDVDMKIKNWTIDGLIEHLQMLKSSSMFDCHKVTRVFGELHMYNGENKDGTEDDNIWGTQS